jgi:sugar phosphate isomerase/epimerase
MEILADLLAEPARRCADAGRPLAIENHGDYYVSDLVALIGEVPELRLFLDTGNTFLIGEKPLPAFREAAPFVVGGHFKDHKVGPRTDEGPLRFEIGPAVLGEGDVPLRECFEILRQETPDFDRVAMLIELIPPSFAGDDNVRAFEQSVAFVKSLEAGRG